MRNPIGFSPAALTLTLTLGAGAVSADADGPDFYQVAGVTVNDTLKIRAKPDPRAAKVGEIPHDGTCIRNLGCQGGLSFQEFTTLSPAEQTKRLKRNPRWCKVEYQGITGWVAGRYLREGACSR
ncbi:MAG: SH3 domain-containing protein [Candidatus Competibacteraceae bacterium]